MMPGRPTYVILTLAVLVSAAITSWFAPRGPAPPVPCGVDKATLIVEVCEPLDLKVLIGEVGSAVRRNLWKQTLADFIFVAAYVSLWPVMGLALHPAVAVVAVLAGSLNVVEYMAILYEVSHPEPIPLVRWAALVKWELLRFAFVALVGLFRSKRFTAHPAAVLRTSTGAPYVGGGLCCLVGPFTIPRWLGALL